MKFNILNVEDKLTHSTSKIYIEENEWKDEASEKAESSDLSQEKLSEVLDEVEGMREEAEAKSHEPLHGKYFSRIGFFPRFASKQMEDESMFDEYGSRHEY
jgi:hypothetical protein